MILYILYNADLLELAIAPEEEALGFVDDALVMVEGNTFGDNVDTLTDFMTREGGGFEWSEGHNSTFALDKLAVVHFTRKRVPDPDRRGRTIPLPAPALVLRGKTVRVENSYKYLGIHVDSQLRWTNQTHEAIAKATKWVLLYRRLTKPSTGLSAKFMRRLYITVAVPKMTYGLDVWYTPPNKPVGRKKNSGSVKALRELGKLQRLATLAINGALRSSPTDLLDAHAGLLPMSLLLKKICFRSLLRICSLPKTNPVSLLVAKCHRRPAKTHRTNIQQLRELFNLDPTIFAAVPAVSRPPAYRLPIDILIADSKEEAIEQESRDDANIRIYTDGSCQEGSLGASAVMYYPQNGTLSDPERVLRCHLGPDTKYSIWDAEAAGAIMALWLLKGSNRISRLPISIYSDSQAVLKSLIAQRASPGFHMVQEFTGLAETLLRGIDPAHRSQRIKLHWIAAHKDVKGNEKADEEAKKAATGDSSPVERLPRILRKPLPPSIGVTKHQYLIKLCKEWAILWSASPRKARVEKLDDDFPFKKFREVTEQLTRVQSSLLFQIRSNHLPLNSYLHRIGKVPSGKCEQCWRRRRIEATETVTHFLFECPSYERERHELDVELGRSSRDLKSILADLDKVRALLGYIGKTRRFKDLGDVSRTRNSPC